LFALVDLVQATNVGPITASIAVKGTRRPHLRTLA
jgi:hypothetical protein